MTSKQQIRLIRRPEVLRVSGFSKSTLYNKISDSLFCPPIAIGVRAVGYIDYEVQEVLRAMVEEKSPDQIKCLVSRLIQQRKPLNLFC